jgi:SHS2 domain-containing protein
MPYRYLDNVAIADVAFKADGRTVEELFRASVDATVNAMVENIDDIAKKTTKKITLSSDSIDLLLFQLLQEIIYHKDAAQLLLRVSSLCIEKQKKSYTLKCTLYGEQIDARRHALVVDVKAVTLHLFEVKETSQGFEATVILDV